MAKGKGKPKREVKKASKAKRQSIPVKTPSSADQAAREAVVKAENARVRQAVHGSAFVNPDAKGVTIVSGRPVSIPVRPKIQSSRGNR